MLSQPELEAIVRKAALLYNRLRSPDAVAKIVKVTPETVTISFSGSFCLSCSVPSYVEDFAGDFKALTNKAELVAGKPRETSSRSLEVDYVVKAG
jgi:hypothetical protein